ncbi:MAG: lysoplasmalogenase [Candidatus Hydrogenedentes bacterium]|nr:lysoplasmalogenase [Candidatus Hydrogenedentota bacterium]
MELFLLFSALMILVLLVFYWGESKGKQWIRGIGKMSASTLFIGFAVYSLTIYELPEYFKIPYFVLVLGLVFSWWGDLFLLWRHTILFFLGLVSFLLAHISYIIAFLLVDIDFYLFLSAFLVFMVPAIGIGIWLSPNLGMMRVPVYLYILVITLMLSLAVGVWASMGLWNLALGALMFYLSDIFVARDRFKVSDRWNLIIGGPLYFFGQLFIASSLMWANL